MTRWDLVPTLDWSWVNAAPVFDLARAFRGTGASHVLIVENVEHKGAFVRALISRRRLIRQSSSADGRTGTRRRVAAVNKAHIFCFLTKPCPPDQLRAAVEAGVIQHRLVPAIGRQKLLIERSMIGRN